jgi:hypothetical protein
VQLPDGFEVVLPVEQSLSPIEQPSVTEDVLVAMGTAGASVVSARFVSHSLGHYLEQLEALAQLHSHL